MEVAPELAPRPMCGRCRRPATVCYCIHLAPFATRTRILMLQHPRERRVGIGTARMAHLSLPNSVLRVGIDFSADPVVTAALAGPPPAYVLFPGPGAIPVAELAGQAAGGGVTLVVVDGTWDQARKLLWRNAALRALPRVAFSPRAPSNYRIRRQPAPFCVSTIEALAEALHALEPVRPDDAARASQILAPFGAMVDRQERFIREVRARRHVLPPRGGRRPRAPDLPARLRDLWPRLLCVQGEANAWPLRQPGRPRPEIVHWLAHRPATGATYQAVVAPRGPLAPGTPRHTGLPAERLASGGTFAAWHQSWQDFIRPDDLVVQWGGYYAGLAASDGLPPGQGGGPQAGLDLRAEVSRMLRRRVGTVDDCAAALGAREAGLDLPGRGGRRLGALVGIVRRLREG